MGSETLSSACYILSDESSIAFYSTSNGYKVLGSSAPPTKRTRNNAGTASERISDVNSPQLLKLLRTRFEEQTEKIESAVREAKQRMLSRLMDRLDIIFGEVRQMDCRS